MKKSELFLNMLLVPLDFAMLLLAGALTYLIRTRILDAFREVQFSLNLPFEKYLLFVVVMALVFLAFYALSGLYSFQTSHRLVDEIFRVVVASSAGLMAVIIYIFLRAELFDSRFLVLGAWLLGMFFVILARFLLRRLQRFLLARYNFGAHLVLIIGDDEMTDNIVEKINSDKFSSWRIIKKLSQPAVAEISSLVQQSGIDEVILANPNYPADKVVELVEFCHESHIGFRFVPNLYQTLTKNFSVQTYIGVPFVELRRTALDEWGRIFKRTLDLIGASLGLILLSPFLGFIAFAIKWETAGPVFVSFARVSRNKQFRLFKFRSMIENAEKYKELLMPFNERKGTPFFKMRHDPRITKVGRVLRKYRLDEFPQLWNVLRGDISLVGPRPHEPQEIAKYQKQHRRVLAIKAGVTGLAQISGSSDLPFEEEVALDTLYIENWSLLQDFKIIALTILKLARDRSAV